MSLEIRAVKSCPKVGVTGLPQACAYLLDKSPGEEKSDTHTGTVSTAVCCGAVRNRRKPAEKDAKKSEKVKGGGQGRSCLCQSLAALASRATSQKRQMHVSGGLDHSNLADWVETNRGGRTCLCTTARWFPCGLQEEQPRAGTAARRADKARFCPAAGETEPWQPQALPSYTVSATRLERRLNMNGFSFPCLGHAPMKRPCLH